MRKIILALVLGALAVSFLPGCGGGEGGGEEGKIKDVCNSYAAALQRGNFQEAATYCNGKAEFDINDSVRIIRECLVDSNEFVREGGKGLKASYINARYEFSQVTIEVGGKKAQVRYKKTSVKDDTIKTGCFNLTKSSANVWTIAEIQEDTH